MNGSAQPGEGAVPRWLGPTLIVLLGVVWGLNWPSIRTAVAEVPPWTFRAICLLSGTALLFGLAWARGARLRVPGGEILPLAVVGFFNVTAYHMLSAFGLTMVEAGRGVILGFTFPLWAVLLGAVFLSERLTAGRLVALGLGLAAMGLLIGDDILAVGRSPLGGMLLVGSAISWATATVMFKARRWSLDARELAAWQVGLGALPVVVGAAIVDPVPEFSEVSARGVVALVYSAGVAVGFGQWIWFRVLQLLPISVASISTLVVPVIGVFSSTLLIGEPLTWRELVALVLVSAALFQVLVGRAGIVALADQIARRGG